MSSQTEKPHKRKIWLSIAVALILALGFMLGYLVNGSNQKDISRAAFPIRESGGEYKFIRPLIGFELGDKSEFEEYLGLERKVRNQIQNYIQEHKASSASVYFRDLGTGRWTGVNEDEKYSPASLYKVALMMAYFKKAEDDPAILDQKIIFSGSHSSEKPDYPPMEIGKAYTILDLINHLIIYSDNDAKDILHDHIDQSSVNEVFSDLGLTPPKISNIGNSMSAKSYARFFRTLYGSTYLSRTMSELALKILSQVEFKDGITKSLPEGVSFPHKYGYRVFIHPDDNVTQELHDCGIAYYPSDAYVLCIMTKGWSGNDLKQIIQDMSELILDEVSLK